MIYRKSRSGMRKGKWPLILSKNGSRHLDTDAARTRRPIWSLDIRFHMGITLWKPRHCHNSSLVFSHTTVPSAPAAFEQTRVTQENGLVKLLLSQWKILLIRQEALDCVQQLPFKSCSVMPLSQLADFITDVPDNPRTFIGELWPHKAFKQSHRINLHQQLPYSVSFAGSLACVTELTNQRGGSYLGVTSRGRG